MRFTCVLQAICLGWGCDPHPCYKRLTCYVHASHMHGRWDLQACTKPVQGVYRARTSGEHAVYRASTRPVQSMYKACTKREHGLYKARTRLPTRAGNGRGWWMEDREWTKRGRGECVLKFETPDVVSYNQGTPKGGECVLNAGVSMGKAPDKPAGSLGIWREPHSPTSFLPGRFCLL
jgi:hypothetical protein